MPSSAPGPATLLLLRALGYPGLLVAGAGASTLGPKLDLADPAAFCSLVAWVEDTKARPGPVPPPPPPFPARSRAASPSLRPSLFASRLLLRIPDDASHPPTAPTTHHHRPPQIRSLPLDSRGALRGASGLAAQRAACASYLSAMGLGVFSSSSSSSTTSSSGREGGCGGGAGAAAEEGDEKE